MKIQDRKPSENTACFLDQRAGEFTCLVSRESLVDVLVIIYARERFRKSMGGENRYSKCLGLPSPND